MPHYPAKINRFFRNARWLFSRYGTPSHLAKHLGISRGHAHVLMNRKAMPSLLLAYKLAEYYGYDLSELMLDGITFEKLAKKKKPTPPARKTPKTELLEPAGLKLLKKLRKKERQRKAKKTDPA